MTDEAFIRCWQAAANRAEVAKAAGMTVASVGVRAARLRAGGVKLKMFKAGTRPKDYKALAKIAREAAQKD